MAVIRMTNGYASDLVWALDFEIDDRIFLWGLDLTRSDQLNMDSYDLMEAKG
jgi:hypothetical protein